MKSCRECVHGEISEGGTGVWCSSLYQRMNNPWPVYVPIGWAVNCPAYHPREEQLKNEAETI